MDDKKALKNAPAFKWKLEKYRFAGRFDCHKMGKWEQVKGKRIDKGIKKFTAKPWQMTFAHNNIYTFIHLDGTAPIAPLDVSPDGIMALLMNKYQHLRAMPGDELPHEFGDP
jgi:hypothetical protein